jgi:hypothetical protein
MAEPLKARCPEVHSQDIIMSDVLKAMDAEIAAIEQDLRDNPDPRGTKIAQLRQIRRQYKQTMGIDDELAVRAREIRNRLAALRVGRKPSPERLRAIAVAKEFLAGKTEPTRTADILLFLRRQGVEIGGSDPLNNLSAMLSNDDGFQAHGRSGWTLQTAEEVAR